MKNVPHIWYPLKQEIEEEEKRKFIWKFYFRLIKKIKLSENRQHKKLDKKYVKR